MTFLGGTKEKSVTAIAKDGNFIKKYKRFSMPEKLDIIAKIEAGDHLH